MEEQRLNAYKIFNSMYTPVLYSNKTCATTKETISKVKRQLSEWEKIIANEATDKESQKYANSSCSLLPEK